MWGGYPCLRPVYKLGIRLSCAKASGFFSNHYCFSDALYLRFIVAINFISSDDTFCSDDLSQSRRSADPVWPLTFSLRRLLTFRFIQLQVDARCLVYTLFFGINSCRWYFSVATQCRLKTVRVCLARLIHWCMEVGLWVGLLCLWGWQFSIVSILCPVS